MLDFLMSSRRFRVGDMLRIGPVKNRMDNDQTLSFSEFTYQILQANDWLFLSQKFDCLFQVNFFKATPEDLLTIKTTMKVF